MKIFVHFDSSTIAPSILMQMYINNNQLQEIEKNIYIFEFDPIVFTHALMLLGQNKNRFGFDLSLYLNTVIYLFNNSFTALNGLIIINNGSTDFKRRISEDLGVGISSLFMVKSLCVRWETIAQIPQNKKLSKNTPDFLGFNSNNERFIYESKGTTQPQNIETIMAKALQQSKGYPENAIGKFAIVSYFPAGSKGMPPFTFIADPPISEIFLPNKENAILLHYKYVLEFAGLESTLQAYKNLLSEKFKLDRQDEEDNVSTYLRLGNSGLQHFLRQLMETFEQERQTKEEIEWHDRNYIGRYLHNSNNGGELFLGVEIEKIQRILQLSTNIQEIEDSRSQENREEISVFSDGTIFKI